MPHPENVFSPSEFFYLLQLKANFHHFQKTKLHSEWIKCLPNIVGYNIVRQKMVITECLLDQKSKTLFLSKQLFSDLLNLSIDGNKIN